VRMTIAAKLSKKNVPGTDIAESKRTQRNKEKEEEPFTKETFEDALKKASRKVKPEEQ
jgi:hypothetical protein